MNSKGFKVAAKHRAKKKRIKALIQKQRSMAKKSKAKA